MTTYGFMIFNLQDIQLPITYSITHAFQTQQQLVTSFMNSHYFYNDMKEVQWWGLSLKMSSMFGKSES